MLIETVNSDSKIGDLFVTDIYFNLEKANTKLECTIKYICLFSEELKMLDSTEKSVFQLSETIRMGNKEPLLL